MDTKTGENMDQNRKSFEAWWVAELDLILDEELFAIREGSTDYYSDEQQNAWEVWEASRKQALEEAAEEVDSFVDDYMAQARGGDNSGASDHKADAAEQIAGAIRSLKGP